MGSVFVSSVNLSFFFLLFFWHVLPFFTKSIQYHCALNTKSKSFIISRLSFIIRNHCFCVWAFPNPLKLKENCYFSRISWKKNLKVFPFPSLNFSLYTFVVQYNEKILSDKCTKFFFKRTMRNYFTKSFVTFQHYLEMKPSKAKI